jgi:hypothetical protein
MSDAAPAPRTPQDFAEERSHRDAVVSSETARATAQAAILINGGAATAILAYLAKDGLEPFVLHRVSWCILGYGLGVVFAACMMFSTIRSLDYYNVRWRDIAFPDGSFKDSPADPTARSKAYRWWQYGQWCFALTMFAFIASSLAVAWTLANSLPQHSPIEKQSASYHSTYNIDEVQPLIECGTTMTVQECTEQLRRIAGTSRIVLVVLDHDVRHGGQEQLQLPPCKSGAATCKPWERAWNADVFKAEPDTKSPPVGASSQPKP